MSQKSVSFASQKRRARLFCARRRAPEVASRLTRSFRQAARFDRTRPERAGSQAARQPGSQAARQPGSQAARRPGSQAARQPGSQAARQPGSQAARQPGSQAARQPAPGPFTGEPTGLFLVSVKKTLLLHEPLPCSPAAETALQALIRCSELLFSYMPSPEESFCSQTPVSDLFSHHVEMNGVPDFQMPDAGNMLQNVIAQCGNMLQNKVVAEVPQFPIMNCHWKMW